MHDLAGLDAAGEGTGGGTRLQPGRGAKWRRASGATAASGSSDSDEEWSSSDRAAEQEDKEWTSMVAE